MYTYSFYSLISICIIVFYDVRTKYSILCGCCSLWQHRVGLKKVSFMWPTFSLKIIWRLITDKLWMKLFYCVYHLWHAHMIILSLMPNNKVKNIEACCFRDDNLTSNINSPFLLPTYVLAKCALTNALHAYKYDQKYIFPGYVQGISTLPYLDCFLKPGPIFSWSPIHLILIFLWTDIHATLDGSLSFWWV